MRTSPRRIPTLLALTAACVAMGGCLKHTIQVTTEPEGALVWINDVEMGRTPLETDFTYYGTFDVRIRREGYEPIITKMKEDAPIQELPGIDLVTEVIPVQMENVVKWHWDLTPIAETTQPKEQFQQDLIARANELRAQIPPTVGDAEKPHKAKKSKTPPATPPAQAAPTGAAPATTPSETPAPPATPPSGEPAASPK